MQELDRFNQLAKVFACFLDGQCSFLDDVVVEFFALGKFGDNEDTVFGFVDFEEFEDVGMVETFEDLELLLDAFEVFGGFDFLFFEDLDGDFLACGKMSGLTNFSESACADDFADLKVADKFGVFSESHTSIFSKSNDILNGKDESKSKG
jgi:hypothetical protein